MLTKLKCTHEKESRKRLEQKRLAESKKKQKNLLLDYFKQKKLLWFKVTLPQALTIQMH
jgi:hypothetical protein